MSGTLRSFGHARRRNNLPRKFIYGPHIDQLRVRFVLQDCGDVVPFGANSSVDRFHFVRRRRHGQLVRSEWALLFEPLLAAAVHDENLVMAVVFQLPKSPRRKPVVVVTIENNSGLRRDARVAQQLLEGSGLCQIAANGILQFRLPVPSDSARNVPLIVGRRVDIDFHETNPGVFRVRGHPFRGDQNFRMSIVSHNVPLLLRRNLGRLAHPPG